MSLNGLKSDPWGYALLGALAPSTATGAAASWERSGREVEGTTAGRDTVLRVGDRGLVSGCLVDGIKGEAAARPRRRA